MKRFAIIVCIALLCLSGCKSKTAKNPGESETTEHDNTHYDALVAGKLSDGDRAAEARGWLDPKQTGNALWKTNREQTLKWVNTLYDAGAEKVLAVYAPKDDTIKINLCANLLVVLPKDKETRKKVIAAYNRIDKELWGSDSTKIKDEGQKYLELNMDP
jgi:hypothetical protein